MSKTSPWSPASCPEVVFAWRRTPRAGWQIEVCHRDDDGTESSFLKADLSTEHQSRASFRLRPRGPRRDGKVSARVSLRDGSPRLLVLERLAGPGGVIRETVLDAQDPDREHAAGARGEAATERDHPAMAATGIRR